jgi:hypothetical protein
MQRGAGEAGEFDRGMCGAEIGEQQADREVTASRAQRFQILSGRNRPAQSLPMVANGKQRLAKQCTATKTLKLKFVLVLPLAIVQPHTVTLLPHDYRLLLFCCQPSYTSSSPRHCSAFWINPWTFIGPNTKRIRTMDEGAWDALGTSALIVHCACNANTVDVADPNASSSSWFFHSRHEPHSLFSLKQNSRRTTQPGHLQDTMTLP